jgi:hypothetical protein
MLLVGACSRTIEGWGVMNDKRSKDRFLIPVERIERSILLIHGQKVILDADLAGLYGVETKQLVRAVQRNLSRFPHDFMFQLNKEEFKNLRCHFGTSSQWPVFLGFNS